MILDELTFERVTGDDGRPMWLASDGTLLPVVRGGSDEGGAEGEGGEGAEGAEGEGESEGGEGSGSEGAPSAEDVAKWKAMSRKHEQAAKKLQAELDKAKAASQTDAEKALTEAEKKGEKAATAKLAQRLAGAEIKAALAGVVSDPASIVEDLNLAKYVTDDGEVDSEAVAALRKKYEGLSVAKGGKSADLKQGQRGTAVPDKGQLTQADLSKMTPSQIVKARKEGRLADLSKGIGRTGDYS